MNCNYNQMAKGHTKLMPLSLSQKNLEKITVPITKFLISPAKPLEQCLCYISSLYIGYPPLYKRRKIKAKPITLPATQT